MKIDKIVINLIDNELKIRTSDKIFVIYSGLSDKLSKMKSKIDENNKDWDKMKKVTNPYELIHLSYHRDKKNNSIAKYIPLSRSYFKMIEMINDFKLLDKKVPIVSASLAEGPGGFMEAIHNNRQQNYYNDKIYGITLPPNNKYIPGWDKISHTNRFNFQIKYGNLYNIDDIKTFSNIFTKQRAYLVTADGGFDYSVDFNNQEQLSYRIIFCEIVTALGIQEIGGNFVCKIFDIFTLFTMKMIYIVHYFYENVYIIKPNTSRTANSEKYIIAKGFKGINNEILNQLYSIIENWDENSYALDIDGIKFSNDFVHLINKFNEEYTETQMKYISKTIKYVNNRPNQEKYKKIVKQQVNNGINWCKKYNIQINKSSRYMNYL